MLMQLHNVWRAIDGIAMHQQKVGHISYYTWLKINIAQFACITRIKFKLHKLNAIVVNKKIYSH